MIEATRLGWTCREAADAFEQLGAALRAAGIAEAAARRSKDVRDALDLRDGGKRFKAMVRLYGAEAVQAELDEFSRGDKVAPR